jgi:hypothetical protein
MAQRFGFVSIRVLDDLEVFGLSMGNAGGGLMADAQTRQFTAGIQG